MKSLVLTGIAQETQLNNPDEAILLLVFNNGELRVPTDDYGLQAVLAYLGQVPTEEPPKEKEEAYPGGAEVFGGEEPSWQPPGETEDEIDDDDYEDVNDGIGQI